MLPTGMVPLDFVAPTSAQEQSKGQVIPETQGAKKGAVFSALEAALSLQFLLCSQWAKPRQGRRCLERYRTAHSFGNQASQNNPALP